MNKPPIFDPKQKFYSMSGDRFNDEPKECKYCAYAEFMRISGNYISCDECTMCCSCKEDKQKINDVFRKILYKTLMADNGALLYIGNIINYDEGALPS